MNDIASPTYPILLVDDEPQALHSFEMTLRSAGVNNMIRCEDSREVMPMLSGQAIELILLDLQMPHLSGETLLPQINSEYPAIPIIVVTGANDLETAVRCMKGGAFDYMVKPVENSRLIAVVKRAIELRDLQHENQVLKNRMLTDTLSQPEAFAAIVTISAAMRSIFQYVEAIAASPRPVLITGETGVGKDLIARSVHALSARRGAFVAVNVAGLDDSVFTDTLFGHKKGAFTDARESRKGLVEQAGGGTLFLDEIGELSMPSQVKLLRLLQDGEYFPLGADVAKRSTARIVIATNRDLEAFMSAGKFRKDLYYRLCAHHVRLPPLRDRREDLPVLTAHFLNKAAEALQKRKPTPPPELIPLLSTYAFPGNVRELEAMIFDAVSRHQSGKLSLSIFKTHITRKHARTFEGSGPAGDPEQSLLAFGAQLPTLKQAEHLLIDEAMRRSQGNQSIAALSLGISRQALNKRLHKKSAKH
jgi:DNA-binding NtrC family response regulator